MQIILSLFLLVVDFGIVIVMAKPYILQKILERLGITFDLQGYEGC